MGNMSYCKFQNTLKDLRDCHRTFVDMECGGEDPLSRDELEAAKELAAECLAVVELLTQDEKKSMTAEGVQDMIDLWQEDCEEMRKEEDSADEEFEAEHNQPPIDSGKPYHDRTRPRA